LQHQTEDDNSRDRDGVGQDRHGVGNSNQSLQA
jgi:hypothetical protein